MSPPLSKACPDWLVGKLDAKADGKGGLLQVHAIHEDVPFDPATKSAVHSEVEELAAWSSNCAWPVCA